MQYWLMKSEPDTFGIDHLEKRPGQSEPWEGVRNFQARNFIRSMKKGDKAFFYHSSCKEPGVAGIIEIITEPYPDSTALDSRSQYFDAKATAEKPRWYRVDVKLLKKFNHVIPLRFLKQQPLLQNMRLLQPGNRLSVLPVSKVEWDYIHSLLK